LQVHPSDLSRAAHVTFGLEKIDLRDAQRDVVFKRSVSRPSFVAFMVAALRRDFNFVASKQAM